jgi:hypothetical protein
MNSLNTIETQINLQKELANESEMKALMELHEQLLRVANSEWSLNDLSDFIKSESDVLDGFEQDTGFFETVRNIQDQIINAFGE